MTIRNAIISAGFAGFRASGLHRAARAAVPVLERRDAPFAVYCAIGFIERRARLWWLELEEAIRRLETVDIGPARLAARTPAEKSAAFDRIYWLLRSRPEAELLETVEELARRAGVDREALSDGLFMDWSDVVRLSRRPLATIGAHSVTHRRLAHWSLAEARAEMADSKGALEARLGIEVRHFAYPVGDRTSAGPREFELARELGFATAVTTRPGMLFPEHAGRLTALPRVSVNGHWQKVEALEALLSGAPFWLWNGGRRVEAPKGPGCG